MASAEEFWPSADSEMAGRIRAFDWASTPLGPIAGWPQSLKTVVDLMLRSPSMMSLVWGAEAIHLHNDSFTDLLREHRHLSLGRSAYETFARTRDVFADDLAAGLAGRSARLIGQRYPVLRNGRLEEAWFDVEYAPVHDDANSIAGVLWTLKETTAQHRAERALRASEERHRLLIESWAQAMWETDAAGVVIADSPSWRAYTGQTLEEWLGYGWLNAIHPDDRAYAALQWREAIATHGLVNAEFRLRAPDGGWRWTNVRAAPVLDAGGRLETWAGMNIDIDARKRAEAALRRSEERYRALFESMDEAYAVVEVLKDAAGAWVDFRFLEVNPAFLEHTAMPWPVGQTATQLLGAPNPRWTELYGQALDTGKPIRVEESEPRLDRIFDLNIFALDQKQNRVAVLFTNITERKRAEAALRESEALRRVALDSGGMGAWTWDTRTNTLRADVAVQRLWGVSTDEQPHAMSLYADLMDPEGAAWLAAVAAKDIAPGEEFHTQLQVASGPTSSRWVELRGRAEHDRPWIINGVSFDITEEKAAATRQKVLVNELQHRARNLLGVITAVADRTVKQGGSVEAFEDRLQALGRAQGLLSKGGSDTVEVGALLRAELAVHADVAAGRVTIAGPGVHLRARQVQNFALAVHELTTNAVKYGALKIETGRLVASWEIVLDKRERRRLALSWVESGVAIEPEKVTRRGYGTELIREALAYALEAEVDYELGADGVRCRIEMPIT